MEKHEMVIGETYKLTYPGTNYICKVISMDRCGDCEIVFRNGKRDCYHCGWLEKLNTK